jgi:regulator of protease activity HflC (stomatin/prohibitin superfamily)
MFWFISAIVFGLIALLWFSFAPSAVETKVSDADYRTGKEAVYKDVNIKPLGFAPAIIALLCLVLSCFAVVGTRNVGVPTVFGKPTGETYGAGLQFKAPWVSVTDIDATIKPEEYFGKNAITVKIADGGDAKIGLSYRWRINPEGADKVFADYRNSDLSINDAVRKALVSTNIKAAINEELGNYDPLAGADLSTELTPEQLANLKVNVVPDYKLFNKAIQKNVEAKITDVGDLIDIQSVTISSLKLPESTQKRINAFNAAVQNTKIALQEVATKDAQAEGNRKLASSLQDPNVLVSKCFDALSAGDFVAPAGFSCWSGGAASVVLPAGK